jgi:hypothetical protein
MFYANPGEFYPMSVCGNNSKQLSSNYSINEELIRPVCVESGNGNKTMILFGNSHAMFSHSAIARHFRGIYSEMTTIFQYGCYPLPAHQQPVETLPASRFFLKPLFLCFSV